MEGWKFPVILNVVSVNGSFYSDVPKIFSPIVTYKGKEYILTKKVWMEGALEPYKGSLSRFAVTSLSEGIPAGAWPEKLEVNGQEINLPEVTGKGQPFPQFTPFKKTIEHVDKEFGSGENQYVIKGMNINEKGGTVTLKVKANLDKPRESRFFLLADDKNRIFSFLKSSIPTYYEQTETLVKLRLTQPLPADISTLSLVVFKGESLQSHLYGIGNKKVIPFYNE
ncbi:hypothetical protein A8F94_19475 [Bacillus sp. FJAT-27225]|uniref:hypothetical protein n=1 Tax=Bacillus sp. FJAT-27225 TaxID=1743144 RepID=UPI00080C3040|nr:hypothetical protein [Bacillus sp. FJAT-27225]OCA83282.1 hypothetical protein A8F94_19475 [Bacillus sp. FJAT-27225]